VVARVAELPLPETLPELDVQFATVTVALSGLVQVQLIVDEVPMSTVDGFAEQEICGGFRGFTVKLDEQLAVLFFLAFGSVMVAVATYAPGAAPFVSMLAAVSFPSILPPVLAHA
jgi:hypothetical protein